jgi:myo-inositol-1(or 4)-monophosphatase
MFQDAEIKKVKNLLLTSGEKALTRYGKCKAIIKKDNTPVTEVEYEIESFLINELHKIFPTCQIISEENCINYSGESTWILDPIDGTKLFLSGIPIWGISLGLISNGTPLMGFYYMPVLGDFYCAYDGKAYLNELELIPHLNRDFLDPLYFLAIPSNAHLNFTITYPRVQAYGSTAYHLALLAKGEAIGVLTRNVNIWDIAGLLPILDATENVYEYVSGKPIQLGHLLTGDKIDEEILVSNRKWINSLHSYVSRSNTPFIR